MQVLLKLPFPPSENHYYTVVRGRKILSNEGRAFKKTVGFEVYRQFDGSTLKGRLRAEVFLQANANRRYDIQNFQKPLWDSLEDAAVYVNDSQIDELHIYRGQKHVKPRAVVRVTELEGFEEVLPTVGEFLNGKATALYDRTGTGCPHE